MWFSFLSSSFFSYYITGFFKMKEVYFLKWD